MSPRLRRLLCGAISATVAVLVLMCVALAHHDEPTSGRSATAHVMHAADETSTGQGAPASHDAPADHCATSDLMACVRPPSGAVGALFVLALGAMALLFTSRTTATSSRPGSRRWAAGSGLPLAQAPPSLSLLCISRT